MQFKSLDFQTGAINNDIIDRGIPARRIKIEISRYNFSWSEY